MREREARGGTLTRLYVARDGNVHVVARARLRLADARTVEHPWPALVDTTARSLHAADNRSALDTALVVVPPVVLGAVTLVLTNFELSGAVAGAVFFTMAYVTPVLRRRRRRKAPTGPRASGRVLMLTAPAERTAFDQAIAAADRVSRTWPALGALIDPAEADGMLAEALWGIAGVLVRRQELAAVLAQLNRPDFADAPATDQTAIELRNHLRATKEALTAVEIDLAGRMASLHQAEDAGKAFIREQEMRRAIQVAEQSLGPQVAAVDALAQPDAAAELADRTQQVLAAYRELTTPGGPGPALPTDEPSR